MKCSTFSVCFRKKRNRKTKNPRRCVLTCFSGFFLSSHSGLQPRQRVPLQEPHEGVSEELGGGVRGRGQHVCRVSQQLVSESETKRDATSCPRQPYTKQVCPDAPVTQKKAVRAVTCTPLSCPRVPVVASRLVVAVVVAKRSHTDTKQLLFRKKMSHPPVFPISGAARLAGGLGESSE